MNFFFDLINHAAGYTDKYYDDQSERVSIEDLIRKYRNEKKKHESNIQASLLLGDHNPHCLLVLEGVHELYRMSGPGNMTQDYLDAIILRLNVSNQGNLPA